MPLNRSCLDVFIKLLPICLVAIVAAAMLATYEYHRARETPFDMNLSREFAQSNVGIIGILGTSESSGFPSQLVLRADGIYPGFALAAGAHRACIDQLYATYSVAQSGGFVTTGWDSFSVAEEGIGPICTDWDPQRAEQIRISFPLGWNFSLGGGLQSIGYFTFPFDTIDVSVEFQASGQSYNSEGQNVGTFEIPVQQWFGVAAHGLVLSGTPPISQGGIVLERPLLVKVMTPILALFLLVPIAFIPRADTTTTAIELAIASFVGVWSVRQALLPAVAPGMTLLDVVLLAECAAVALGLTISLALNARRSKLRASDCGTLPDGICGPE